MSMQNQIFRRLSSDSGVNAYVKSTSNRSHLIINAVKPGPIINSSPAKRGVNDIDKFFHNVTVLKDIGILAETSFFLPFPSGTERRVDTFSPRTIKMSKMTPDRDLARKIPYNNGNPERYNSRHFKTNSIILAQPLGQPTPTMNMGNFSRNSGRMAIRHLAVTVRQLLPRDCALVNPEIPELYVSKRPPTITFFS